MRAVVFWMCFASGCGVASIAPLEDSGADAGEAKPDLLVVGADLTNIGDQAQAPDMLSQSDLSKLTVDAGTVDMTACGAKGQPCCNLKFVSDDAGLHYVGSCNPGPQNLLCNTEGGGATCCSGVDCTP